MVKQRKSDEAMVRLSQRGGWSSQLDDRARDVLATRFSEPGEEAFDFALCARHRDGSIYGIADGKQCRVGRPVTRTDALKTLAKQGVPRKILGKIARIKDDNEFGKATRAISSGRKKQAATITPTKPSAASSIKPAAPKAGAPTQAKRKEAVTPDGRAEKRAKIAQLRAELKARRDKQNETKKPVEQQKAEARKANMEAAVKEPKKRISVVPDGQKTNSQLLIEKYFPGVDGTPNVPNLTNRIKALELVEKKLGPEKAQEFARAAATLVNAGMGNRQLSSTMSAKEIERFQSADIKKKLMAGYEDPTLLIGGKTTYDKVTGRMVFTPNDGKGAVIKYNNANLDDEFVKFFLAMSPPSFQAKIEKAGKAPGNAFAGYDKDGKVLNEGTGNNEARKIAITRQWIRQNNQSAYSGLPLSFANADLEHIRPMGLMKNAAENPNNFVWTSKAENQTKRESPMAYMFSGGKSFPGADNVKDLAKWNAKAEAAESKAAANKSQGSSIKEGGANFLAPLMASNDARAAFIATYRGGGGAKNKLDKVVKALGEQPWEGRPDKIQNFRREMTWKAAPTEHERRNAKKFLLTTQATFNTGNTKGKMSVAEWISWNFPEMTGPQKTKTMQLWEDVIQQWSNNPEKTAPSWIASTFAMRAGELF